MLNKQMDNIVSDLTEIPILLSKKDVKDVIKPKDMLEVLKCIDPSLFADEETRCLQELTNVYNTFK